MPDLLAGTKVLAQDTPPTEADYEAGSYTFTNTSFGVTTTGGTYADCGTAFIAPTSGRVLINFAAQLSHSGTGSAIISPVIREGSTVGSGTVFQAASDDTMIQTVGSNAHRHGAAILVEGLTPGDTYNVRLEHKMFSAGTATAVRRQVIVQPVP